MFALFHARFLFLSSKGDGKIARNYPHCLLHNLIFQMKDKSFQDLVEKIDLEQAGYLDYHGFLDLVEEKKSLVSIYL